MAGTTKPKKRTTAAAGRPSPEPEPQVSADEIEELTAALAATAEDESSPFDAEGNVRGIDIDKRGEAGRDMTYIFTLDGVRYFVPTRPNRLLLTNFLRKARASKTEGDYSVAVYELLTKLLGPDAIEAMETSPKMGDTEIALVMSAVTKVAFDALAQMGILGKGN